MNAKGGRKIRVLLAKVGLDGHDRGVRIVARYLMEAGMEVIFTGLRSTPEEVVGAALEEDVDVVGLSFLAGDHLVLAPKVIGGLRQQGLNDKLVLVGGIIPKKDIASLQQMGVGEVFLPGTRPERIAEFIRDHVTHSKEQRK